MIVTHLNTGLTGGAAIAARRLHESLLAAGVDSRFRYSRRTRTAPPDSTYQPVRWPVQGRSLMGNAWSRFSGRLRRSRYKSELRRALRGRPAGFEIFSQPRTGWATPYDPRQLTGDILHLHWVANFIDYTTFFSSIPDDLPIVWTLHDMNPLTGGCHHADDCERHTSGCRSCPQLAFPDENDLSSFFFQIKEKALRSKSLHVVAPSQWVEGRVRRSRLLAGVRSIQTIYHGIDTHAFAPEEKVAAKTRIGLPRESIAIVFGSASVENPRKGFQDLAEALSLVKTPGRIVVVATGRGDVRVPLSRGIELKSLGYVDNPAHQATIFSAADIVAMPSSAESFGLVTAEAMACGTPVVAYAVGAVPEMVLPGRTGLLACLGDRGQLARHIQWLIDNPDARRAMGQKARCLVSREFEVRSQTREYIDLYCRIQREKTSVGVTVSAA